MYLATIGDHVVQLLLLRRGEPRVGKGPDRLLVVLLARFSWLASTSMTSSGVPETVVAAIVENADDEEELADSDTAGPTDCGAASGSAYRTPYLFTISVTVATPLRVMNKVYVEGSVARRNFSHLYKWLRMRDRLYVAFTPQPLHSAFFVALFSGVKGSWNWSYTNDSRGQPFFPFTLLLCYQPNQPNQPTKLCGNRTLSLSCALKKIV
jgi:hypothetical protein